MAIDNPGMFVIYDLNLQKDGRTILVTCSKCG